MVFLPSVRVLFFTVEEKLKKLQTEKAGRWLQTKTQENFYNQSLEKFLHEKALIVSLMFFAKSSRKFND